LFGLPHLESLESGSCKLVEQQKLGGSSEQGVCERWQVHRRIHRHGLIGYVGADCNGYGDPEWFDQDLRHPVKSIDVHASAVTQQPYVQQLVDDRGGYRRLHSHAEFRGSERWDEREPRQ